MLPGHCWQGTLQNQTAAPVGYAGDEIIAVRHHFGRGEVLWVPTLLGLGARLEDNGALSALLYEEAARSIDPIPFRFARHQPGVLSRTLETTSAYVTILINKQDMAIDIELILPEAIHLNCQPEILSCIQDGQISSRNTVHLPPEETMVVKWSLE